MTYQQISDNYRSPEFRDRAEMCIREQGMMFTSDGRAYIKALGQGVVGGNWVDIEAVMAAVATGPNGPASATDDGALLAAVQYVWPTVAAARYPQLVGLSSDDAFAPLPMSALPASTISPATMITPNSANEAVIGPPDIAS